MKRVIIGCSILLILVASLAYAQYLGSTSMPMWVYSAAPPSGQSSTVYSVVRLTDGTSYYTAGGSGGGDGKILDGTSAGQADVLGSAPAGTEQGLVVRNIPSGTQPISATSLPLPSNASTDRTTAAAPFSIRLSDGTSFYTGLTDAQLRATAVSISGTVTASGPLTDTQLRASAVATTSAQGTAAAHAGRWPVMLSDGTAYLGTAGNGTGLTVTCTNCGGAVEGQTYIASVFASAAGASKDFLNVFNASGSGKVLKIRKVKIAPELSAVVTGLVQSFRLSRYTTDGSTCTSVTVALADTSNSAVPAQVTAKTNCTTDPTALTDLLTCAVVGDETGAVDPEGICYQYFNNGGQPITLREGQGLMIKSSALSGAWPVSISIEFTM